MKWEQNYVAQAAQQKRTIKHNRGKAAVDRTDEDICFGTVIQMNANRYTRRFG